MRVRHAAAGCRLVRTLAVAILVACLVSLGAAPGVAPGRALALGDAYADFSTQPLGANIGGPAATGEAGVAWPIQPVVSLYGDWDPTLDYLVDLRIDPASPDVGGPGRLSCSGGTTAAMTGGIAAFRGCRIDTGGRAYRLTAVVTPYDRTQGPAQGYPATSLPFDIRGGGPSVAATIGFTTQPLGATYGGPRPSTPAGRTWSIEPVVSVLDADGNVVTSDDSTIVLLDVAPGTPQTGGPGVLSCGGGMAARVHRGVARFAGCSIDAPGTYYQLRAQTYAAGSTPGLTGVSLPFDVTGGNVPARVRFTTEPLGATLGGPVPSAPAGTPWDVQPVVSVVDAAGRVVRGDDATLVTLAIDGSSLPVGGRLYCAGGTTVQALAGLASFLGCQVVGAGAGYVLRATAVTPGGALVSDLSLPFTIAPATSPLELQPSAFTVAPNGAVTLTATLAGADGGRSIVFERQGPTDAGWTAVGTSATGASGAATLTTTVARTSRFRATCAGRGTLAAAASAPDTIAVAARVTLTPAASAAKKGSRSVLVAKVMPSPLGPAAVRFQVSRYAAGSWASVAQRSIPVDASGTAKLPWTWGTAGRWRVIAIAPTTASYTQGRSSAIVVTVR